MILLWGLPGDQSLVAVRDALLRSGQPLAFLDQQDVLETEVKLCVGSTMEGMLRVRSQTVQLNRITAVYLRPYDSRRLPIIARAGEDSQAWHHAMAVEDILMSWVELTPALVVNRPTAMATNSSKPYQAALIHALGFKIPDTLITTDPNAALDFWKHHDAVIYKSVSGIRSVVSRLSADHLDHLENIVWCPTQFQQYIAGSDYRVHVVGEEIYACKILSSADDYRYAAQQGSTVTIQPCGLPEHIGNRCKALAGALNLPVAGVDLRHSEDDQWYCFEVNPSPGFSYFQRSTNQPIDKAIAKLLISGALHTSTLVP